jgi:hypothetical protein
MSAQMNIRRPKSAITVNQIKQIKQIRSPPVAKPPVKKKKKCIEKLYKLIEINYKEDKTME